MASTDVEPLRSAPTSTPQHSRADGLLRTYAVLGVILWVALALATQLAALAAAGDLLPGDATVARAVHGFDWRPLDYVMQFFSIVGGGTGLIVLLAVARRVSAAPATVRLLRRSRSLGVLGAGVLTRVLKDVTARPRPELTTAYDRRLPDGQPAGDRRRRGHRRRDRNASPAGERKRSSSRPSLPVSSWCPSASTPLHLPSDSSTRSRAAMPPALPLSRQWSSRSPGARLIGSARSSWRHRYSPAWSLCPADAFRCPLSLRRGSAASRSRSRGDAVCSCFALLLRRCRGRSPETPARRMMSTEPQLLTPRYPSRRSWRFRQLPVNR